MQPKENIEFICTGNRGRSPPAELIGRNNIRARGLSDLYDTISSGIIVESFQKGEVPSLSSMKTYIQIAANRDDVYDKAQQKQVKKVLAEEGFNSVDELNYTAFGLYQKAVAKFIKAEEEFRREVLPDLGIEGTVKEIQTQTVPRSDVIAIFGMGKEHADFAQKVYQSVSIPAPEVITPLGAYATGDPNVQFPNTFGKTKQDYFNIIKLLQQHVPASLDKLFKELKH